MNTSRILASKIITSALVATLGTALSEPSFAKQYSVSGTIGALQVNSTTKPASTAVPVTFFAVNGLTSGSVGNCGTVLGVPLFDLQDNAGQPMYAMLLATSLAGGSIAVTVDDTYLDSNKFCIVESIGLPNGS